MGKEKDHDTFADAVAADTDGQGGGAEDEHEDEAGERIVDREVEGAGKESGSGKAEKVNRDGDEDDGDGVPAAVHGIAQTLEEVDEHGATGEFLGKGKLGQESGQKESEEKKKGAERAEPGQSGGERSEGGIGLKAVGCPRKKKKGQTEKSGHAKDAIQQDGESGARFLVRKPAEKIKKPDSIASGRSDEEEIKKEADKGEMKCTEVGKVNLLQTKKKIKAGSAKRDRAQGDPKGGEEPAGMGGGEALGKARPVDFGREEAEDGGGDAEANPRAKTT